MYLQKYCHTVYSIIIIIIIIRIRIRIIIKGFMGGALKLQVMDFGSKGDWICGSTPICNQLVFRPHPSSS